MPTEIIGTDEFAEWYQSLTDEEAEKVTFVVDMLADQGVGLSFPYSSKITGSNHAGMRELRTSHAGGPLRVLYIFDPRRMAVLLVGGSKLAKGNRWYEAAIRQADRLYAQYLSGA